MKTYRIICPSCNGVGYISNPSTLATSATVACPACNGTKVVMVCETSELQGDKE